MDDKYPQHLYESSTLRSVKERHSIGSVHLKVLTTWLVARDYVTLCVQHQHPGRNTTARI